MYFLDAGLPFKRNPMREFILNFGANKLQNIVGSEYRFLGLENSWIGSTTSSESK